FSVPERRELPLEFRVPHFSKLRGLPARLVVLVHDHGAYAFIKVVPLDDPRHYAEFRAHARLEIPALAAADLSQGNFQAERRLGAYRGRGFLRPFGVAGYQSHFTIEGAKNVLDAIGRKDSINGDLALRDWPLLDRLGKGSEHGVDGDVPRQPVKDRVKLRGVDA